MRYAILGDIHANLTAFRAVLDDIRTLEPIGKIWCLGDIVGYGPDPHECIKLLRETDHICVAGNHDQAATGKLSLNGFNPDAAEAIKWTADQLSAGDISFLNRIPEVLAIRDFTLVHGSPRLPVLEYVLSISNARENFGSFKTRYCLVGHTHVPQVFMLDEEGNTVTTRFSPNVKLVTGENRLIINPGGVGQPRDGDARASYAVYDDETAIMQLRRVPYDIRATQDRMVDYGLPLRLAGRLGTGR
jgi:diadenosine tetraphosphatase ApaH/serine/threonine PP2A family protein phosphatase